MDYCEVLQSKLTNVEMQLDGSYSGSYICSNKKLLNLKIVLPQRFPVEMPKIYIANIAELSLFLPHVEINGLICYSSDLNLIVDDSSPQLVLTQCVKKAIDTIESGIKGQNISDFRKEFIAFWDAQKAMIRLNYLCTPSEFIKPINISYYEKTLVGQEVDGAQSETISRLFSGEKESISNLEAYQIPIREKNNILPPNPQYGWTNKEIYHNIRNNLTASNKRKFDSIAKMKNSKTMILILDIPLLNKNNNVVIGFMFKKKHSSLKNYRGNIQTILVNRLDNQYLLERTSGDISYVDLNIAIIGVGAVGSKIAEEIGALGVSRMTLVDNDIFTIENLYRHSLGADSLKGEISTGKMVYKVDALQEKLESRFPYLQVDIESMNVLDLIEKCNSFFEKFDFIFVCIGDTMASLELNKYFYHSSKKVFYSWLEPLGVGGHTLFIDYSLEASGCFNCLYTDPHTGKRVSNRASFVKQGQVFEKTMASCRSKFIPYSSLLSSEAAVKTVKLFHKIISEQKTQSTLTSWIGDTKKFEEEGYKYSERYSNLYKGKDISKHNFSTNKCSLCGIDIC